jgi:hypothetical protein
MSNIDHFTYYLQKYPECRSCFESICKAWKRNGYLPARIVLQRDVSQVNPWLTEVFGPGTLHLGNNNTVTLITSRLFQSMTDDEKEQWTKSAHDACGITFVKKTVPENTLDAHTLAINKWRLIFPELADLTPVILESRSKSLPVQKQLDTWILAGTIVAFLNDNTYILTVSDLGAKFCNDSKALRGGELIAMVTDWLTYLDTGIKMYGPQIDIEYRKTIRRETLERHGVVENRCSVAVTVYGPLVFDKNGQRIEHVLNMWGMGESALLSLENLDAIENIELPDDFHIYTCENESPFANLVRKRHQGLIIYTRGFPNSAVCKFYRLLSLRYPDRSRFHWGDTDFAGLQIAAILNRIAPLRLWRCDKDVIEKNRLSLIAIDDNEKERIRQYLETHAEFPFREELELTRIYGWFEQERFEM